MRTGGTVLRLSGLVLCGWLSLALAQESPIPLVDRVEAVGLTVADMERSLAFYTNVLAFQPVSDVEVTGAPYEHLQMMPDVRANDLVHWQITLRDRGLDGQGRHLLSGAFSLISPGIVELPDAQLGFHQGLLARDPDGHALQLIER
jgi:catechol 2,3-dioxygenase-like lactoylglutathione lyase family enzyme